MISLKNALDMAQIKHYLQKHYAFILTEYNKLSFNNSITPFKKQLNSSYAS